MARSKCAVVIGLSSALLIPLFLTTALATPAQAAVCDGSRRMSERIAASGNFFEADTAFGIPGGKVVLRVGGPCAWGLIESPLPWMRTGWVWLERKQPGSSTVDRLGERKLGGTKSRTHTGAYTRAGYYVRACGAVLDNRPSKNLGYVPERFADCTKWSLYI
ncbi:hypothetical protein ABGB14_12880 [Nonomuraea sp. B10E15]|uniref:hypothetical protein n=1 Tax=Nonomuraea sp. B10E15 TaxID=3153560 RepID=UPI00325D66A4